MFECSYKFELSDCLTCAKYVYKSQKRKQDKIIAILIPILLVGMIAMLIYDIVKQKNIVWDIVLISALVVLEIMYLLIPAMLTRSQKKMYNKQNLGDMDCLKIVIDDKNCVETMMKDEQAMAKNVHSLRSLTSYIEDSENFILVFNSVEFVCIKKAKLVGDLNRLKDLVTKSMAKTIVKK